jgi:hypothetical protein
LNEGYPQRSGRRTVGRSKAERGTAVATWRLQARAERRVQCLACGSQLEPALLGVGSIRCLECRDTNRALDSAVVNRQRTSPVRSPAQTLSRHLFG